MSHYSFIPLWTILRKETHRFLRIWPQTLLPAVITIALYFIIFGGVVGRYVGTMDGYSYRAFITPGLIIMPVITNAYANVSSSFFGAKFNRSIEEMLVSSMSDQTLLWGYIGGGVLRGLCTGVLVMLFALIFIGVKVAHPVLAVLTAFLASLLFSLLGFINGLYAKKFDDVSIIPTFVLTPLTYLGGVFYSVALLPGFWHAASLANPIFYIVATFRHALLGQTSTSEVFPVTVMVGFCVALYLLALFLLKRGVGIRT